MILSTSLGDIAIQSSSMDSDFDITFSKAELLGMKKYCVINEESVKISNNLQDCLDLFFKHIIFDQPNLLRRLS